MGRLILVLQDDANSHRRALDDLGMKILRQAGSTSRLYFVRTNSGLALDATACVQTCMRDSHFDYGHTKVRILLDEPVKESFMGMDKLLDEMFGRDPDAVIVLVNRKDYCTGLFSYLIGPCNPAEFDWSTGKAVVIPRYTAYFRAGGQL